MILDRIAIWCGRTSMWCFAIIVLIMVYEVVARYAFNAPTIWAHESAVLLASLAFVFGGAFCMAEGTHMRITLLVDKHPRFKRFSDLISHVVGAIYLAGLTYAAWKMADRAVWRFSLSGEWDPERSGSTLNSPLPSYLKIVLLIGCALFLLVVLRQFFSRVSRKQEPEV